MAKWMAEDRKDMQACKKEEKKQSKEVNKARWRIAVGHENKWMERTGLKKSNWQMDNKAQM